MDQVTSLVAQQYTDYPYPPPVGDVAEEAAAGVIDFGDPSHFGPLIWPEGRPGGTIDILIAGCGSTQAARIAFTNPNARVVGIDLSDASLAHERCLREKHGLSNLELFRGDLREVAELKRSFDLIISSGVLHHLADPSEGLAALRDVLKPNGAMVLMVYGTIGRTGIYMLQDIFRRLGIAQTAEGVATVRHLLNALPDHHFVKAYTARAPELQHDTAIIDTFLHPQDRSYTVPELLSWVAANGLSFQAWSQNQAYYPDAFIDSQTKPLVQALPDEEQWAIVEQIHCLCVTHTFVVRQKGNARRIDFSGMSWLGYRPILKPGVEMDATRSNQTSRLKVWALRFDMSPAEEAAVRAIDGVRTIEDIMSAPRFRDVQVIEREAFARTLFENLWRIGAAMFHI